MSEKVEVIGPPVFYVTKDPRENIFEYLLGREKFKKFEEDIEREEKTDRELE